MCLVLLFLWALYNFKGFPLVHRGQGAEVSRHCLTSLSPPPQKGETHTHRGRRRKGRRDPGKHFHPLIFLRLGASEALSSRQSALQRLTLPRRALPPLRGNKTKPAAPPNKRKGKAFIYFFFFIILIHYFQVDIHPSIYKPCYFTRGREANRHNCSSPSPGC